MVARRLHAVTPRNLLLLDKPVVFLVIVEAATARPGCLSSRSRRRACPGRRLLEVRGLTKSPVMLDHRTGIRRPQIQRLEQELAAYLPLVARLRRQAVLDLLQPLHHRVQRALQQALAHISRSLTQSQGLDHAQLLVQLPCRVCVDGEGTACLAGVHVDQGWVAAAYYHDEGADGEAEEGVGGYGVGEGSEVFLAVLQMSLCV